MKKLTDNEVLKGRFYAGGKPLENGPEWGMTLKAMGSMRFRWNEVNENRLSFINTLEDGKKVAQVELIHSKDVRTVHEAADVHNVQADGIITINREIIPMVTVADCMPIYMYDPVSGVFGMLHSGWKGTGILKTALEKAHADFEALPENFSFVFGPHIHNCCYAVDEERSEYFAVNFTPSCVTPLSKDHALYDEKKKLYALSLAEANLQLALNCGVKKENIFISSHCTCCNEKFGSFRRENPEKGTFTVQSAWVKW